MGVMLIKATTPTDVLGDYRPAGNASAFHPVKMVMRVGKLALCSPSPHVATSHPSLIIIPCICIALDNFQRTFTDFILFDPLKSLGKAAQAGAVIYILQTQETLETI